MPKKLATGKKISKLINNTDSETDDEIEHELSFYVKDRVKLMKEVLKIMKPKKIKSMAPECMKNMKIDEINSVLLEELLGISNKRLKCIFKGENFDGDSSSTEDDQPVDVISLDDVSEDDFIAISDEDNKPILEEHKRKRTNKTLKQKSKKFKKEKSDTDKSAKDGKGSKQHKNKKSTEPLDEENLMSVLELLELQARARAIRSQIALENKKSQERDSVNIDNVNNDDDEDEVIIEDQTKEEILISSSGESDDEQKIENPNKLNDNSVEKDADKSKEELTNSGNLPRDNTNKTDEEKSDNQENVVKTALQETLVTNENNECSNEIGKPQQQNVELNPESAAKDNSNNIETQPENKLIPQLNDNENGEKGTEKELSPKKAKRLKLLKNKLESYKKDVSLDSNIKILENVVLKESSSSRVIEDNDGLVINIDQDDLDCIICD